MDERRIVLYIASSLDGYIATQDENLDWLLSVHGEGDNGYSQFYDTIDTIIIGRKTYDWIMTHENGNFPYPGKECFVFSNTRQGSDDFVSFKSDDPVVFADALKRKPGRKIWIVGGGILIDAFLRQNCVDEIILSIAPVLLGSGIPLFLPKDLMTNLILIDVKRYGQFAELHYTVVK